MTKARDIASAAPAPSTVSATELGYLDGVTSNIQTQIDSKTGGIATDTPPASPTEGQVWLDTDGTTADANFVLKSTLSSTGDIFYASAANTPARLAIGSTDQVLKVSGGVPSWGAASSSSFVGCLAAGNTQVIANNTETAVTFASTEVYDTDNFHSTVTNTSRITIPSGKGGYYYLYANVPWENANSNVRQLRLAKNGTALTQSYNYIYTNTGSLISYFTQSGSTVVSAAVNDYFEVFVNQTTGGNLTIYGDSGAGNLPGLRFGCVYLGA